METAEAIWKLKKMETDKIKDSTLNRCFWNKAANIKKAIL